MSEHTPLPWHIPCPEDVYWVMDKDKHPVCCFSFQGDGKERHLANAKFIVEACNSHAKLIAENKRLRKDLFIILGYLTGRMDFYESVNDTKSFELVSGIKKSIEQALNESE